LPVRVKILFYYPTIIDDHERRKQTGICEGVYEYMRTFISDSEHYEDHPIEIINTDLFTVSFKEFEPNFFL